MKKTGQKWVKQQKNQAIKYIRVRSKLSLDQRILKTLPCHLKY